MARIVKKTRCPACNSYPSRHYYRNSKWQYHCKTCGIYFTADSLYKNLSFDNSFDEFIRQFIKKTVKQEKITLSLLAKEYELSRASVYRKVNEIRILASVMSWFINQGYIKKWAVSNSTIKISLVDFIISDLTILCSSLKNNSSKDSQITLRSQHYFNNYFNQSFTYNTNTEFTEIISIIPFPFDQHLINAILIPFRKMRISN